MTQSELAAAAGIDQGTLSLLENGKGGFSRESLEALARALKVSIGVFWADSSVVDSAARGLRRIPVLTSERACYWKGPDDPSFEIEQANCLYTALQNATRHAFALTVSDTKNSPVLEPGDHIILDPGIQPWPGSVVAGFFEPAQLILGRFRDLGSSAENSHRHFEVVPMNLFHSPRSSREHGGLSLKGVMVEHRRYVSHGE